MVDILLAKGADPNEGKVDVWQTPYNTCLGGAIKSRNTSIILKLLDSGANVNLNDEEQHRLNGHKE